MGIGITAYDTSLDYGDHVTVVDPVCKMRLNERDARFKSEYGGRTYYFCALSDKKKFDEDPEKYLEK